MIQLWALIKKEFLQIYREPMTLGIIILGPVLMLILYGYSLNSDVKHIGMIVCDRDNTLVSREFISGLHSSEYFDIRGFTGNSEELIGDLDSTRAKVVLWVPEGFGNKITVNRSSEIFLGLDASDANTATVAAGYFTSYLERYSNQIMVNRLTRHGYQALIPRLLYPFKTEQRIWYNPELKSAYFIVPGLISTILMMLVAMITAMAITRERERNTFEQLAASPIHSWQLIIGKLVPYACVSFGGVILIIPAGILLFGVPFRGSWTDLFLFVTVFLVTTLGIGLTVSTIAKTQLQAVMMVSTLTTVPAIFLSGFIFPIEKLPAWIQILSNIAPAKFFLIALRGIFLKGTGLAVLWPEFLKLSSFAGFLLVYSALKFKKRLD
jgi:ABC-2 type transport system permease protein